VVFLSGGLKQIGEPKTINAAEITSLITRGATNKNILLGVFFEAIFFGFLLYMLSQKDVSIVWPLTALGFVITSLAAKIFLKEEISSVRWAGICLIVLGAGLVTWSAKQKDREPVIACKDSCFAPPEFLDCAVLVIHASGGVSFSAVSIDTNRC
jgi:drug/metabolite transporter (DMT)-like permease